MAMTAGPPDSRYDALRRSAFGALPEPELRRLASEVHESRLLAGHLLYDPDVTVVAAGLLRAFIGDDTGRQVTVTYLRPGATLALAYLAGRRYPTAFQAVEDSRLVVVGNDRARRLHETHPALGWATIRELSARLDDLETELAYFAFGQLRQRLAYHLLALTAGQDGPSRPVHLAHLATAVGSSREMVSRTLAPLGVDGTLRTEPAGVTVTDRHRLRDHANID
jgi:CRP-like cAMP-binding protein